MITVFNLIRQDARDWWYHRELRQKGRIEEARKLEHKEIKHTIQFLRKTIKNKGFFQVFSYGWRIESLDEYNGVLSHCTGRNHPIIQACILLGIPEKE